MLVSMLPVQLLELNRDDSDEHDAKMSCSMLGAYST